MSFNRTGELTRIGIPHVKSPFHAPHGERLALWIKSQAPDLHASGLEGSEQ